MAESSSDLIRGDAEQPANHADADFLDRTLESLKEDGCNILVTGSVAPEVSFHATRNLFGVDGSEHPRQRIIACTDLHPPGNHYLWTGYEETPELVSSAGLERGLSTMDGPTPDGITTSPSGWIGSFQRSICEAIGDADAAADDLEPAQLRLSVMTLRPVIERVDYREADRFLRVITNLVDGVSGMAHYHLPAEPDSELVTRHADHFDVQVELRNRDGVPAESRWHFADSDRVTTWHTL